MKYKQFSKMDPEAIVDCIQSLLDQNQLGEIIDLEQTLIIKQTPGDPDFIKRGKVKFFSFAEEKTIGKWLSENDYETVDFYRCPDGYLVLTWEYHDVSVSQKAAVRIWEFLEGPLGPLLFLFLFIFVFLLGLWLG